MKIERQTMAFTPITITLQTKEDADMLMGILSNSRAAESEDMIATRNVLIREINRLRN